MSKLLTIKIRLDGDVMSNSDEVTEAIAQALDSAPMDVGDTGTIFDMAEHGVGIWKVEN